TRASAPIECRLGADALVRGVSAELVPASNMWLVRSTSERRTTADSSPLADPPLAGMGGPPAAGAGRADRGGMTGHDRRDGAAAVDAGVDVVEGIEAVRPGARTDAGLGAVRVAALLDQAGSRVATGMS